MSEYGAVQLTLDGSLELLQRLCVCLVHLVHQRLVALPPELLAAVEVERRHVCVG